MGENLPVTVTRQELTSPVGNWTTLNRVLEAQLPQIQRVVANALTPDKLARLALTAMRSSKQAEKVLQCTGTSVAKAFMDCAETGLSPSPQLGQCCFVPYGKELQLQVEYRGFISLAKRSGEVSYITADVVREGDRFEFQRGTEQFLHHVPGGEGKPTHYYALVRFKDGATDFRVMTTEQVEKHRDKYSRQPDGPAWKNSFDAMAMKTCIRQLCKLLELSPELTKAAMIDEYNEVGVGQVKELTPGRFAFGRREAEDPMLSHPGDPEPELPNDADIEAAGI